MPVLLRNIKKELQSDRYKKGRKDDGSYKHRPPNLVSRQLKDYSILPITKLDTILRRGIKAVDYSGMVKSETTAGMKYRVTVRFLNIPFADAASETTDISGEDSNGNVIYYGVPNTKESPLMLKCSCQDFRHRFEHELNDVDALIGAPRKYKRKTPLWPLGAPYANSTHKLGICKHIHSMLLHLKGKKLIRGAW